MERRQEGAIGKRKVQKSPKWITGATFVNLYIYRGPIRSAKGGMGSIGMSLFIIHVSNGDYFII